MEDFVKVPLTQGKTAIVDADDQLLVADTKWCAHKRGNTYYALTSVRKPNGSTTTTYMHRVLLGLTDPDIHVDHINGDGLDNRRSNLRFGPCRDNLQNRVKVRGASGYLGVNKHGNAWKAQIRAGEMEPCKDGKMRAPQIYLGTFSDPREAALVYDRAALDLQGPHASTNESLGLLETGAE